MEALTLSLGALGAILVGALTGTRLRARLPEHHLKPESLDLIRLAAGLISTMAALVLGLMITSAKGSFDRVNNELLQDGARLLALDRMLSDYGPDAKAVRERIKTAYAGRIHRLTGSRVSQIVALTDEHSLMDLDEALAQVDRLTPRSEAQRRLQLQAATLAGEIAATRSLLILHQNGSIPIALVVVLIAWLVLIFAAFGIVGTNAVASRVTLLACALAAASAVFLILEMDRPFGGVIAVHAAPLYDVLARLGR